LEIAARGAVAEDGAHEPDAQLPAAIERALARLAQFRARGPRQRGEDRRIAALQLAIVLALVGEEEVRAVELEHLRGARHPARRFRGEAREAFAIAFAPSREVRFILVDLRQHEPLPD